MKALIVDDEKHVRDAIRLLVDWNAYGITSVIEAQDGSAAMRIIEQDPPELLFTDMMMPGVNGVQLLEWLQAHYPRIKSIVISGHDDFEFVRNTVKYGGMDYILKPIDPLQLNEAVAKAMESRMQADQSIRQNQQRSMEINQIKPVYWDKMFSQLITEPSYFSKIEDSVQQEFGFTKANDQRGQIAILSLDTMDRAIRHKFDRSIDLLFFSLINICNEYLRSTNLGLAFRYWNSTDEIMLLLWRDFPGVSKLLERINEGIFRTYGGRFDMGLGSKRLFPAKLNESFQEARSALRQRNLVQRVQWIHEFRPELSRTASLHFSNFEENIRFALRGGHPDPIRSAVDLWFNAVKQLHYVSIDYLEHWWHEINLLKTRWLKELLPDAADPLELPIELDHAPFSALLTDQGNLSLERWMQQLTEQLLALSQLIVTYRNKDKHVIFEIAKYIQNHYHQDITLQDIASHFFLSREYISRKFKQEFKEKLSDYIGRIRIEEAKVLLRHPQNRITHVAATVGYQDEKYFSKVFKKIVGISPTEYRKLNE